jgi:hypothetical protein
MGQLTTLMALTATALGVATSLTSKGYITPSYALAHAAELDGHEVTIGGFVDLGTNSRCLYDSMQAIRSRDGTGARVVTLSEGDNLLHRRVELNHRFVLVTGTFRKIFNEPEVLDLYQCNEAGIEQKTVRRSHR